MTPGHESLIPSVSKETAEHFFALSLDLHCITAPDGHFKYLNPAWSELLGYASHELLSVPYLSFLHPDDRDLTRQHVESLLARDGQPHRFENRYRRQDGTYVTLLWHAMACPEDGLIYATARDLTEQKRKERRQTTQYAVVRELAETATAAEAIPRVLEAIGQAVGWVLGVMWYVDPEGKLLRCGTIWTGMALVPEFEQATGVMTFPPGIGLPGRVWSSGQPAWIADIIRDTNFPRMPFAASSGLHGAFAFPIMWHGTVSGVMEFFSSEVQNLDDHLLSMMGALGLQIGQFFAQKRVEEEREVVIRELREALASVKTLSGLLPICSSCKKIRDDNGYWNRLEDYILAHSDVHLTHGLCTECARSLHPDWDDTP